MEWSAFLFFLRGLWLGPALRGGFRCMGFGCFLLWFFGMLPVQFAINIFKNTAGKRIVKQVAQHVLFRIGRAVTVCGIFFRVGGLFALRFLLLLLGLRALVCPGCFCLLLPRCFSSARRGRGLAFSLAGICSGAGFFIGAIRPVGVFFGFLCRLSRFRCSPDSVFMLEDA